MFDIRKKIRRQHFTTGRRRQHAGTGKQTEQNKKDMEAESRGSAQIRGWNWNAAQGLPIPTIEKPRQGNDLLPTLRTKFTTKTDGEKVEALKANSDLSSEQRQAALAQIRTETEHPSRRARDKLSTLPKQCGWWINNLAPSIRKR